jgi:hypothetical protein
MKWPDILDLLINHTWQLVRLSMGPRNITQSTSIIHDTNLVLWGKKIAMKMTSTVRDLPLALRGPGPLRLKEWVWSHLFIMRLRGTSFLWGIHHRQTPINDWSTWYCLSLSHPHPLWSDGSSFQCHPGFDVGPYPIRNVESIWHSRRCTRCPHAKSCIDLAHAGHQARWPSGQRLFRVVKGFIKVVDKHSL